MRKNWIEYFVIFLFSFVGTWFVSSINGDALWNYGFSVSILQGLVPYRDFNMVVTPFYPFLCSFFLRISSSFLFFYLFNSLLFTGIYYLTKSLKGNSAILLALILFLFSTPTYNFFSFFLILLLLFLEKKECSSFVIGFVCGLLVLTKQSIFPLLMIALLYSCDFKAKLMRFFGLLVPLLFFLFYLVSNGAFNYFLDYCFFGLSSFYQQNFTLDSIVLIGVYVFFLVYFLISFVRTKNRELLYILSFQIIAFPIFDIYHIGICLCLDVFYFLDRVKVHGVVRGICFFYFLLLSCYFVYSSYTTSSVLSKNIPMFYGKAMPSRFEDNIEECLLNIQKEDIHHVFIYDNTAYMMKIALGIPLNEFDLINYGNMGKGGYQKLLEKQEKICEKEKCLFVLSKWGYAENRQICVEIIEYVKNNYEYYQDVGSFEFYRNYEE